MFLDSPDHKTCKPAKNWKLKICTITKVPHTYYYVELKKLNTYWTTWFGKIEYVAYKTFFKLLDSILRLELLQFLMSYNFTIKIISLFRYNGFCACWKCKTFVVLTIIWSELTEIWYPNFLTRGFICTRSPIFLN